MKNKHREVRHFWWSCALSHWNGTHWITDDFDQVPNIIMTIDELVADVARSRGDQFRVHKNRLGAEVVKVTGLAQRILDCERGLDTELVLRHMNRHSLSPYFELLSAYRRERSGILALGVPPPAWVPQANEWVDSLRELACAVSVERAVKHRAQSANMKAARVRRYLGALLRRYLELQVIQLDLGYRNDPRNVGACWIPFNDDPVDIHLKQIRTFVRQRLRGFVGSIWRVDYSAVRGYSCRLMLFLDGSLRLDGAVCCASVAEHWSAITGRYGVTCNWSAFARYPHRNGPFVTGVIDISDEEGRSRLIQEATSLARLDYYARFKSHAVKRTFGRGEVVAKLVRTCTAARQS